VSTLRPDSSSGRIFGAIAREKRYAPGWRDEFIELVQRSLIPAAVVLDVGGGRRPVLDPARRVSSSRYVGLDLSRVELEAAPPGSYDDVVVADLANHQAVFASSFDLIVAYQVLEHVPSLVSALENLRSYLRPQGRLLALVSGAFSAFAILNRLLPGRLGVFAMRRLLGRNPGSVFHAYYDRCWYSALVSILSEWSTYDIVPVYRGADYFGFSSALNRAYLTYEDWAARGHRNLATHYVINAVR
jgi:SAM-dependent methyltransferase